MELNISHQKLPAFKKFIKELIKRKILKNWGGKHLFLNQTVKEKKKSYQDNWSKR